MLKSSSLSLSVPLSLRLKKSRKPRSMVRGDIFPDLVTRYADMLAILLTDIFNSIWPRWKNELVTVIPKARLPDTIGDLRNISCTRLACKVF